MASPLSLKALRDRKAQLIEQLIELDEFRAGSLVGRYRKCGRPWCHCAREGSPGHGPSWSLTRTIKGKTVTKIIHPQSVEMVQHQIAGYHRFQQVVSALVETNTQICDTLLATESNEQDGPEGAEKRGSSGR